MTQALPRPLTRFIAASGFTNLSDGVATVVWAWVASLITRDPVLIAVLPIMLRLPWFLFAIPAGIVTDRVDRRRLILAMDAFRGLVFLVVTIAVWAALPLPPASEVGLSNPSLFVLLMVSALAIGVAEVFRDNAAQTMLPSVVPHDQLERANGRLWSVEIVGHSLLGPALGAFLVAIALPLPFALNACAFALAVVLVLGVAGRFQTSALKADRNWRAELGEGWRFLRGAPLLRILAVATGLWNMSHQMVLIGLLLLVQEVLDLGPTAYGLILSAGAVGGLAGGFMAEHIVRRIGQARAAQWASLASAVAFAAIPLAPDALSIALVFVAFEFTGIVWNTVSVSYRQRTIPDDLLGRVNSLYRLLAWGMMPLGLYLAGATINLAETIISRDIALTVPFYIAAAGSFLLSVAIWRPLARGFAT